MDLSPEREAPLRPYRASQQNNPKPVQREVHPNWNQPGSYDLDEEDWLPGAVKCKERKHTKFEGGMKIQTIKRIFTMKDGSVEIVEDRLIERMS